MLQGSNNRKPGQERNLNDCIHTKKPSSLLLTRDVLPKSCHIHHPCSLSQPQLGSALSGPNLYLWGLGAAILSSEMRAKCTGSSAKAWLMSLKSRVPRVVENDLLIIGRDGDDARNPWNGKTGTVGIG